MSGTPTRFSPFLSSLNPMVLMDDSLVGFERSTPHFKQLFCTFHQRLCSTTDTKHGGLRGSSVPIYFRFVFQFRFSFLFAWFLFCLRGFLFYLRGFFCLRGFLFVCMVRSFICMVSFLFAWLVLLFAWFLFCLRGFL